MGEVGTVTAHVDNTSTPFPLANWTDKKFETNKYITILYRIDSFPTPSSTYETIHAAESFNSLHFAYLFF